MSKSANEILKEYWGFDEFRPMQSEIIQSVLDGQDTLALLPTGGGKSICFQVPALMKEGICIVVSPLIALMKDQVYNLKKRGINAVAIYSGMHYKDIDRAFDNCIHGKVKFLYLSPERLTSDLARARIEQMTVNLLAIDEAHCISQWGYDFRPSYLEIINVRELMPKTPVMGLTATATSEVVKDIQERLEFKRKNVFRKSFSRENLAYVILHESGKLTKLNEIVSNVLGSGIIYVRSRRKAKDIAIQLKNRGVTADFYHAGLSTEIRSKKQEDWINDKIRIMVCTNAFGMGIDKPDVRLVVHLEIPDSLEAYFQEAGRAGRDGKKSYAVLLYHQSDKANLIYQYEQSYPSMEEIRKTYRALGNYYQLAIGGSAADSFDFDLVELVNKFKLQTVTTYNCMRILEQEGWISLTDAVFNPASVRIRVRKDELYDYQLRNKKADRILKLILRSYHGAFNDFVGIHLSWMAKNLKINYQDLEQSLLKMAASGIIDFRPEKDKSQLVFLQEKVDPINLTIDFDRFNFRKKRHLERLQKTIAYAENTICRSQQLLSYFGEKNAPKCKVCDVCLERTKVDLSKDDFERYRIKIIKQLEREPLTIYDLCEAFSPKKQAQVLKTIELLIDEGDLSREEDKIIWKK
ncbi:MAG: RecQ family ATP-dependent DNA helicase [Saprospiraceae bacterium]|nr:RecQ family ATP-dependent DNA helicase [Saprospiraceae bacterium]